MHKEVIHTPVEFLSWWQGHREHVMSFDTETTSLDYLTMELEGFSLCNGTHACYVDVLPTPYVRREVPTMWIQALKDVIDYLDIVVMHNAAFDLKVLYKYGIEPKKIWCTLTAAKLVNENRGKGMYSLKVLAVEVLKVPKDQVKAWDEVEQGTEGFYDYAINDAIWTWQLYEIFKPILKEQDLIYLFEVVEMPFQFVLADLERNGVLVDKDKLRQFKPEVQNILFQLEVKMLEEIGMEHDVCEVNGEPILVSPINFNSSLQLAEVAEGILGLEIKERTRRSKKYPKGQKSVDKFTIARLRAKSEFFALLSRYRKLGTLYKTFLKPCEKFLGLDDHIRATYRMVVTGRLSCSRPNLQNLPSPKKEKLEFNHRLLFIPRPGYVFIRADWAGQELRVLAEESQDERMMRAFVNCEDLHLVTANRIFDLKFTVEQMLTTHPGFKEAKNKYAQERDKAKNGVNFPIIYGKTVQTLAEDFNIPVAEAQRWMDAFHGLYPNVKKAIQLTKRELQRQEYVVTMMGRRRRFPGYNNAPDWKKEKILRQAFNFKIQGFSAEMMKLAAAGIRTILVNYDARIVLTIHDELIYEVREEQAEGLAKKIKYIMEHTVRLSIPIVVDVSIVDSYGA